MTTPASGPACCRCDPALCETDDTGDHCTTSGCAYCLEGCPAPDKTPCCQNGSSATLAVKEAHVHHPKIRIDNGARQAYLDNQPIALGRREYDLLNLLHAHAGLTLSFDRIARDIYQRPLDRLTRRMISAVVMEVRRKLGGGTHIINVRGVGFRFNPASAARVDPRVEIDGAQWGVLHWERQPDRDGTAVFTLYARPAEAVNA